MNQGWLLPGGRVVECGLYEHVETAQKSPQLKKYLPNLQQYLTELENAQLACQRLTDEGEHPEWHMYECEERNVSYCIQQDLLEAGCLRIGTTRKSMHFEGTGEGIRNLREFDRDLAESYGKVAVFEAQYVEKS